LEWLNNVKTEWLVNGATLKITINNEKSQSLPVNNGDALLVLATANQNRPTNFYDTHPMLYQTGIMTTVILAPMHGGIWTLCISLTGIFIPISPIITIHCTHILIKFKMNEMRTWAKRRHIMILSFPNKGFSVLTIYFCTY